MNTASATQSPSTRQKATVVREYGPFPVEGVHGVTHDGTTLYIAGGSSNEVVVVDAATGATRTKIPVGQGPWGIVVAEGGR